MKERPIIFTGDSVRAILDGRKTQTRRVVKPQPPGSADPELRCPYGRPGERLYVKETWADAGPMYGRDADPPQDVAYFADKSAVMFDGDLKPHAVGRADLASWNWGKLRKRSPLYLPRWASRLTLEVVSVRLERLHKITNDDARAEGVQPIMLAGVDGGRPRRGETFYNAAHRNAFAFLWNAINGKRAAWSTNPWVWRVEFRRVP